MPPDRQTGRHFLFHFFKEDFCHENPFPTPAQHGTGAEYAADLPARFGFRRRYPPPPHVDPQKLNDTNTYTDSNRNEYKYTLNTDDNTATLTKFTGTDADVPSSVTASDGTSYTVTTIGENAFVTLNSAGKDTFNETLESVFLPSSIQTIEHGAFAFCTKLSKIVLPEKLTTVGNGAFTMAGLTEVTLPKSLKKVGETAFWSTPNPITTVTYTGTETDWLELLNSKTVGDNDTIGDDTVAESNPQLKTATRHCAHTVTFNKNGHGDPEEQVVQYVVQYDEEVKKPNDPTADGFTFKYWFTKSENGEEKEFDFKNTPITKDTELFAHWVEDKKPDTEKPDDNKPGTPEKPNEPTTPEQPGTQEKPNEPTTPEQPGTQDVPAVEEDDTAAIGYAAAAVTAAFVGWGAYRIGSEVYLKYLLPKDVLLPQNRIQLAELLWEDAGRPAPADAASYADVDANDTDARQAARWAVENGLLTLPDAEKPEEFVPYRSVSYAKSARAWNKAQQLKENAAR